MFNSTIVLKKSKGNKGCMSYSAEARIAIMYKFWQTL